MALRHALRLLDDPHALVRAQACRTAATISAVAAAPCIAPLLADPSWEVREAARDALVTTGSRATEVVLPLLDDRDPGVRSLAALVLHDIGYVDELVAGGSDPHALERILAAGGRRLRALAAERARNGRPHAGPPLISEAAAS